FRLPALEPYDGSTDPTEHVAAFKAQMALYDTFDTLMCRTFPTTLRGPARMRYSRMKPSSISSFDQFVKEFELNFIASSCPRSTVASLLGLNQGNDKPLTQFVSRFSVEVRKMPDIHPTMAIQAFLIGLWSSCQYVAAESLVVGKREDHKKPRCDKPQGQPFGTPRRKDRPELPAPRPLSIPLNSTRTEIEDLIRQEHLHRFVRDRRASEERPRQDRNPSPRPDRPIEKQIDVIVGRPTSGGNSSSARKAYAQNVVEKRPRRSQDPEITFGEGDDAYPVYDNALVISAQITNA
ncbi:hypothetical protein GW17_00060556, partial [Ensete ventricosum]